MEIVVLLLVIAVGFRRLFGAALKLVSTVFVTLTIAVMLGLLVRAAKGG